MFKQKTKTRLIALLLAGFMLIGIGEMTAYFTDSKTVVNQFTVGNVSIKLEEPDWNPESGKDITPNKEVAKNPIVTNDGKNNEFVFATVTVPYDHIIVAEDNGTKKAAADTELYTYDVASGWVEIPSKQVKNTENKTVTHLYVYGTADKCTVLAPGNKTPNLFPTIKFVNAIEGQGLEGTTRNVTVKSYAIQSNNINRDSNGEKTAPVDVWSVIATQKDVTEVQK